MSGFQKVKISVYGNNNLEVINDEEPRLLADYQKFYDYEEFNDWAECYFLELVKDFPEDVYTLHMDTLGAYGCYNGKCTIEVVSKKVHTFYSS